MYPPGPKQEKPKDRYVSFDMRQIEEALPYVTVVEDEVGMILFKVDPACQLSNEEIAAAVAKTVIEIACFSS